MGGIIKESDSGVNYLGKQRTQVKRREKGIREKGVGGNYGAEGNGKTERE